MIPAEWIERLHRERSLTFAVKVIPKSSKDEVTGLLDDGSLRLKVTAPPVKGKANSAVCELLAEQFNVPKRNVEVLRGETSHIKQIRVNL